MGARCINSSTYHVADKTTQRFYRIQRLRAASSGVQGAETIAWKLRPDTRSVSQGGDREGRCRRCHARIVLSPDDRRQGYCFDCYEPMEIRAHPEF